MDATGIRDYLAAELGWRVAAAGVLPLAAGTGGRTYRVDRGRERYVVRAGASPLRPRLTCEPRVLAQAAAAGVSPELVHADPEAGVLVTRFLEGRSWTAADLASPSGLECLADLLRRVHQLPLTGEPLDLSGFASRYRRSLESGSAMGKTADRFLRIVDAHGAPGEQLACCHNDAVAANVVEGRDLRMIDWEYCGDNDPLFDLASLIGYHDLPPAGSAILLDSYAGGAGAELREKLREQCRLFDALQWLWLAAKQSRRPAPGRAARLSAIAGRVPG